MGMGGGGCCGKEGRAFDLQAEDKRLFEGAGRRVGKMKMNKDRSRRQRAQQHMWGNLPLLQRNTNYAAPESSDRQATTDGGDFCLRLRVCVIVQITAKA